MKGELKGRAAPAQGHLCPSMAPHWSGRNHPGFGGGAAPVSRHGHSLPPSPWLDREDQTQEGGGLTETRSPFVPSRPLTAMGTGNSVPERPGLPYSCYKVFCATPKMAVASCKHQGFHSEGFFLQSSSESLRNKLFNQFLSI